jgi:hypothetical protein
MLGSKTSLDIVGTYLNLVRARFVQGSSDTPWMWSPNKTEATIVIESGNNELEEKFDSKPSIFVDRNAIVFPTIAIGNSAGEYLPTGRRYYYTTPSGQVTIDCVSRSRGESSTLADMVAHHLVMSGNILRKAYGFKNVTPVTLTQTQPWEKDDRNYLTRVTSEFTYDVGWKTDPEGVILSRIRQLEVNSSST